MVNIATFKSLALSLPDTIELPHFEKTSFRIIKGKIFATLDTAPEKACVKLTEIDQSIFCAIDATIIYPVNNKWGKQGWTLIELKKVKKGILKEALLKSYSLAITPVKKIKL